MSFFDDSHVTDVGLEGSLGPSVSAIEMIQQNFRQQFRVDSARALDDELRNRWLESLRAANIARTQGTDETSADPFDPWAYRAFSQHIAGQPIDQFDANRTGFGEYDPTRRIAGMIRANEAIKQLNDPNIKTFEQILEEVSAMQREVETETASMSERASMAGNIVGMLGSIAGSFTTRDPLNIITAHIGAGRNIATRIASEMGLAGVITGYTEIADVAPAREIAGLPERDPLYNIAAAVIGAGVIRGGIIEPISYGMRRLRGDGIDDIDIDARDTQLAQMFAERADSPRARAAASVLDDTIFIERNNPFGEGRAASERFVAELQGVQRAMNAEPATAIARVLPPLPFEYIQKAADFEIVREQSPAVWARMEELQASVRAIEDRINNGTVPAKLKVIRDNPGGEWTQRKQQQALEASARAEADGETTGIDARGLRGSTTMTTRVRLPTSQLRQLEGVLGERPVAGQVKFDNLTKSVEERGFQQEGAVMVWVNHLGQPYIYEGNNRIAVAALNNVDELDVEIQWRNGAEDAEGPFSIAAIKAMLPPVPMAREDKVKLRAERRLANREYQTSYRAVEAEAARLREAQARAEAAQQNEASNVLARVSGNQPFVGPLLRFDAVESLVDRINRINETLDEDAIARFGMETRGEGDEATEVPTWQREDGRIDIGLRDPVDPEFKVILEDGTEVSVAQAMRDLQDDVDLVEAIKVCAI